MPDETIIADEEAKYPSLEDRADWIYYGEPVSKNRTYDIEGVKSEDIDIEDLDRKQVEEIAEKYEVLSGKWVLEYPRKDIDNEWTILKEMMRSVEKPNYAKVSSRIQSDNFHKNRRESPDVSKRNHVICVYTKDFRDKDDVMDVLENLKDWGFDPIGYKEDVKTVLDIYSDTENLDEYLHNLK
ncbi:MAG: putative phosphothreonine lyase domain-containing protein [Candidatus Aenigmatarchaeota archaeon]